MVTPLLRPRQAASPACTELEMVMMDWLGKMLQLPDAFLVERGGEGGGVIQVRRGGGIRFRGGAAAAAAPGRSLCFLWRMSRAELLGRLGLHSSLGAVSPGSPPRALLAAPRTVAATRQGPSGMDGNTGRLCRVPVASRSPNLATTA